MQKLKRERRALEQRSKDLVKLPNRKERSEIEAVEAILQEERKGIKAKEARHKLTVERLRQQIIELQVMQCRKQCDRLSDFSRRIAAALSCQKVVYNLSLSISQRTFTSTGSW